MAMTRANVEAKILAAFSKFGALRMKVPSGSGVSVDGKVYELYVLADLLKQLSARGFDVEFSNPGGKLYFKAKGGYVIQNDPHFDLKSPKSASPDYQVFVNVYFTTLGSSMNSSHGSSKKHDKSDYHELDIGVFVYGQTGKPNHDKIAMAVECKAVGKFTKAITRGMLGLRRELSFLTYQKPSTLSLSTPKPPVQVPADPPSEIWLVTTDRRVSQYSASPLSFGIECKALVP
jgi:hypothetical protein